MRLVCCSRLQHRFNAPDIGAIQLDETDRQQLEILQNKVELYLQRPETQEKMDRLGKLLHDCAQRPPGSARAADAKAAAAVKLEPTSLPSPGPTPCPSPATTAAAAVSGDLVGEPNATVAQGTRMREETEMLRKAETEKLLSQAIEAKRQLEARIEELRAATSPK